MPEKKAVQLYTDGACRGNPGSGGAGAVLFDENGDILTTAKKFLGTCTNNEAEYAALILGLEKALSDGHKTIQVFLDSELLVRQINGIYRVKNDRLKTLMQEVQRHLALFDGYTVKHVPRSENAVADRLANEAIDDELDMA
ncbi:MAG: ribonuclease HI family protein [Syntrophobacterales bacterium]|nr:MAG: ribonuclease HI family protein [Syntrophobacterales bacterium]